MEKYFPDVLQVLQYLQRNGLPPVTTQAVLIYFGIIFYTALATIIIPGKIYLGSLLKDGTRVPYKINGFPVHYLSIIIYVAFSNYGLNFYNANILYHLFPNLMMTGLYFSIGFTLFLYSRVFILKKEQLNIHGSNFIMNFWLGVELNPHFFGFEIKLWSYKPAFIIFQLISLSALFEQYQVYKEITYGMILFNIFISIYLFDALYFEEGMCTMFDIIIENFGFMLVFGDYFWIAFVFPLTSIYLVHLGNTSNFINILTIVFNVVGFIIFRGSNGQKKQFKENPEKHIWGKPPAVIKTNVPNRNLLISGWWGIARKINYLGDILMAISWCMTSGFELILPWFYAIYLILLLIQRAIRDDHACRKKYGAYWEEYCKKVPYQIIPYVY